MREGGEGREVCERECLRHRCLHIVIECVRNVSFVLRCIRYSSCLFIRLTCVGFHLPPPPSLPPVVHAVFCLARGLAVQRALALEEKRDQSIDDCFLFSCLFLFDGAGTVELEAFVSLSCCCAVVPAVVTISSWCCGCLWISTSVNVAI